MLKIKKHFNLHLPSHAPTVRIVAMSPVYDEDDDELIQAINNQPIVSDDQWTLTAAPDTDELNRYWNHVEEDIAGDPEWFAFDDD